MSWSEPAINQAIQSAVSALQASQHQAAESQLRAVLAENPHSALATLYLGTCLLLQPTRQDEGGIILEQLLASGHASPAALENLGLYYYLTRDYEKSEIQLRRALAINPDDANLHSKLAASLFAQARYPQCVYHAQQALLINPARVETYSMLMGVLHNLGRWVEAFIWSQRWRRAEPNKPQSLADQAAILAKARFYTASNKIIEALPDNDVSTLFSRAMAADFQRNHNESIAIYRQLIAINPDTKDAARNLSLQLLAKGEFAEAWTLYEGRFGDLGPAVNLLNTLRKESIPQWDGCDLNGAGILVHSEQGIGDVIQFLRFMPLIQQRGGRVIFSSYPDVLKMLKTVDGAQVIHNPDSVDLSYQWHIPLLSLGKVFINSIADIPFNSPYINAPADKIAFWQAKLATDNGVKIGLVWAGNPEHVNDHNRSAMLDDFSALGQVAGTSYYGLQKGPTEQQAVCPPLALTMRSLSADIHDLTDTAAIIAALDLVICVDTSVAHLAGAMGKPVWLLVPDRSDWRWLHDRDDSPWYPSMRLFRRGETETWPELLARVAVALEAWCDHWDGGNVAWLAERQAQKLAQAEQWDAAQAAYQTATTGGGYGPRLAVLAMRLFAGRAAMVADLLPPDQVFARCCLHAPSAEQHVALLDYWQSQPMTTDARSHYALVAQLHEAGQFAKAAAVAQAALQQFPQHWAIRYLLAQCLRKLGDDGQAEVEYTAVLTVNPRHPEAGINCAFAQERLGKSLAAMQQLQYTALCHPYHPLVRRYLAVLLFRLREFKLALIVIEAHRENWPNDTIARFWHGSILRQMGNYTEAITLLSTMHADGELTAFELALECGYSQIGANWADGAAIFQHLAEIAPPAERAKLNYSRGLYCLGLGDFTQGWAWCEARLAIEGGDTFGNKFPAQMAMAAWDGAALNGRRLLIYCEQGYGDTIQFVRFLTKIDGDILLVYQDGLEQLLVSCFNRPNTVLISRSAYRDNPLPADFYINLLSLPYYLHTGSNFLPECVPYLTNSAMDNPFAAEFAEESRPRIGLQWAGSPKHGEDHWRSIDVLLLKPLFAIQQVAFYSLQKGAASTDVLLLPAGTPILNAAALANNFMDTLHLIQQLDLVISVDTAVAHLAGAMGKPVWLLLPKQGDWRWVQEGEQTDWYPTMRLFRQSVKGEWADVIVSVMEALQCYEPSPIKTV